MATIEPLAALALGLLALAVLAVVLWPRWGLLARVARSRDFMHRVYGEDALKHVYEAEVMRRRPTLQSLAGALQVTLGRAADTVADLQNRELLDISGEEISLNPAGRRYALNIIRAHRLWEQHLAEETGVAEAEWHRQAERKEHFISPEQADQLAARLGHPPYDPHGDPIPTARGELAPREGSPLATIEAGQPALIVHIEDEPESIYAQIEALGLYPGMTVRLLESSPQRVRFWADGEEHVLAPVVAANITVKPVAPAVIEEPVASEVLASLLPGASAHVLSISPRCRGVERRRLLDLGILPGTRITAEIVSPAGNCTAYRIRDALIALRREQAGLIHVKPAGSPSP